MALERCDAGSVDPFQVPAFSMDGADAQLALSLLHGHGHAHAPDQQALGAMGRGTAQYQRVEVALAEGFIPLSECVPGMGCRSGRPDRFFDPSEGGF